MTQKPKFINKLIQNLEKIDKIDVEKYFINLSREKGFLESIFNNLNEGIIVISSKGTIAFLNSEAKSILGIFSEEYKGRHMQDVIKDESFLSSIPLNVKTPYSVIDKEITVNQPRKSLINVNVIPFDDNNLSGMVIVLKDITAKKKMEEDTKQSKLVETFSHLAAGIAHEIGNPLNSLNIHLQLIDRETKKSKTGRNVSEHVSICRNEIKRLDEIINRFLLALRSSEKPKERKNVNKIISSIVKLMQPEFNSRKINFTTSLSKNLPDTLLNEGEIKQLVINVLKNAIQSIDHARGEISISTLQEPYYILINIRDNGSGISDGIKQKIFEPFFSTKESGSGLGLLIASRIVSEHKGTLELESSKNKGTLIKIRLPVKTDELKLLPQGDK
ncbi:MAG: PAS domain S-box protein [Candidatus Aureabacteria bacterium]|nr:PAS domain S-box protein [Candidatus Auribacterota bacterium]